MSHHHLHSKTYFHHISHLSNKALKIRSDVHDIHEHYLSEQYADHSMSAYQAIELATLLAAAQQVAQISEFPIRPEFQRLLTQKLSSKASELRSM